MENTGFDESQILEEVVEEELPVLREAAKKATEMEVPQIPDLEVVKFGSEPTGEDADGGGVEMLQVRTGIFVGAGLMMAVVIGVLI